MFSLYYENDNFCGIKFGSNNLLYVTDEIVEVELFEVLRGLCKDVEEYKKYFLVDYSRDLLEKAIKSKKLTIRFLIWTRDISKYRIWKHVIVEEVYSLTLPQECFGKYVVNDTTILYLNNLISELNSDWKDIFEEYKRLFNFEMRKIEKMKKSNTVHRLKL